MIISYFIGIKQIRQQIELFILNLNYYTMGYQYDKKVKRPYEEVISTINEKLLHNGFSIITSINVNDSLKEKLGINFRNYRILSVCNPELAYKAISLESHSGVMLPCNILVQEHENGEVELSAVNPMESSQKALDDAINCVTKETSEKLRLVIDEVF
jgi:uncharacterized protein (DUF302 family)